MGSDTYFCDNYALKQGVTIENRENADPMYRQKLYNNAAEYVTGKILGGWENRVALQVNSTSNVGSSSAVTSSWNDLSNSDPLGNLNTAIDNVYDATGYRPNRLIFGEAAWRNIRKHSAVRNLIHGLNNGGGYASIEQVKALLEIDHLLVGGMFKNTGAEAQATVLSRIWTDNVLAYYAPDNPSIDDPSFMYTFRWAIPGIPNMQAERHPYDPKIKAEEVEVGVYQEEKIIESRFGFLLTAVNSST